MLLVAPEAAPDVTSHESECWCIWLCLRIVFSGSMFMYQSMFIFPLLGVIGNAKIDKNCVTNGILLACSLSSNVLTSLEKSASIYISPNISTKIYVYIYIYDSLSMLFSICPDVQLKCR